MKLVEAAQAGISRLRLPQWRDPKSYVKISIFETQEGKTLGPWCQLFDRNCQELLKTPCPHLILTFEDKRDDYVAYEGEIDKADIDEAVQFHELEHNSEDLEPSGLMRPSLIAVMSSSPESDSEELKRKFGDSHVDVIDVSADAAIQQASKYPYDATDAWNERPLSTPFPRPIDKAHLAARAVIADLEDRRGIKNGFNDVDEETRSHIVKVLSVIIRKAMA